MGGLGKTQLVAEYAYAHQHQHHAILIVSADSEETMRSGIADLCGVLKLPQAASNNPDTRIKATLDWLASAENRGWLLILDNVDDEAMLARVVDQARQLHYGTLLITSRLSQWPQGFIDLELDVLDSLAATEYLLEATADKRNSLDVEQGRGTDQRLARKIVENQGALALGIAQAAATINTLRWSFADYLREWDQDRQQLLDDPRFDPRRLGYPRSVATTWLTTYRQLPAESQRVFDALCWFAPDPIAERVVTTPWPDDWIALLPADLHQTFQKKLRYCLIPLYDFCLASAPRAPSDNLVCTSWSKRLGGSGKRKTTPQCPSAVWLGE